MFGRIGRLFRGVLGLFISGIEQANPEALMEAARQEFRSRMTQYNLALARMAGVAERLKSQVGAKTTRAQEPLSGGPFRGFLDALHRLQDAFPAGDDAPIRTALVTARSAPAHKRVILTLREWGVRLDEALFLGGRPKGPFLEAFGADIFFDDSLHNIDSARQHVAAGLVPHGISNNG